VQRDQQEATNSRDGLSRFLFGNRTTFPIDPEFLNDLGFAKKDFYANFRDLQSVLTKLQEFTWHWDQRGPLSSRPGEPGPVAYIIGRTLVLGPQLAEAHSAFMTYARKPPGTA
jgi:hypothetical protein